MNVFVNEQIKKCIFACVKRIACHRMNMHNRTLSVLDLGGHVICNMRFDWPSFMNDNIYCCSMLHFCVTFYRLHID